MHSLDAVLVVVIALSSVWGAWRGMLRTVSGLLAFAFAFFAAKDNGPVVFRFLAPDDSGALVMLAGSYLLVFFVVFIPLMLLSNLLRAAFRKLDLDFLDKWAGGFFGFARGMLLAFAAIVILSLLSFDKKMLAESVFLPAAGGALRFALNREALEDYRRYWRFDDDGVPVFDTGALARDLALKNYRPGTIDLDNLDLDALPEGIDLKNLPEGIDINNLPEGIDLDNLDLDNLEGIDIDNLPEGIDLDAIKKILGKKGEGG